MIEAVTTQLNTLGHTSNLYATEPGIALAEALVGLLGADERRGCSSATPAPRPTRSRSRSPGSPVARNRCRARRFPRPHDGVAGVDRAAVQAGAVRAAARRRGARALRRRRRARRGLDDSTAAVFLEPIMGEGGVVVPPAGYLVAAREHHDDARRAAGPRRGADRNGPHRRVFRPPARRHHARHRDPRQGPRRWAADRRLHRRRAGRRAAARPGLHGSTFGGNPVCAAAALAVLRVLADDDLVSRADVLGKTLHHGIESLRHPLVDHVRGRGLLRGIVLSAPAGQDRRGRRPRRRVPGERRCARRDPAGPAAGHHRGADRRVPHRAARRADKAVS